MLKQSVKPNLSLALQAVRRLWVVRIRLRPHFAEPQKQ
jgi:hypothetical protein